MSFELQQPIHINCPTQTITCENTIDNSGSYITNCHDLNFLDEYVPTTKYDWTYWQQFKNEIDNKDPLLYCDNGTSFLLTQAVLMSISLDKEIIVCSNFESIVGTIKDIGKCSKILLNIGEFSLTDSQLNSYIHTFYEYFWLPIQRIVLTATTFNQPIQKNGQWIPNCSEYSPVDEGRCVQCEFGYQAYNDNKECTLNIFTIQLLVVLSILLILLLILIVTFTLKCCRSKKTKQQKQQTKQEEEHEQQQQDEQYYVNQQISPQPPLQTEIALKKGRMSDDVMYPESNNYIGQVQ